MQRRAWRPTRVCQRAGAAVVDQDDVHGLRSVVVGDAGPGGGVGVHPLAGRRAGQQLQEDLEVRPGGDDLFDADDADQCLGQGQAHAPVALGLHDDERSGLGDGEVSTGDADLGRHEFAPQVRPGGAGERTGVIGEVGWRVWHLAQEDLADLGPVEVDGGHQDVAGEVVVELHDQLGEVGLQRGDALGGKGLVHAQLLGQPST